MSKNYVIDIPDDAQYILINGASENHCYTRVEQVDDLEELNSDYINEHYGELQDEAYQRGLDDAWVAVRKIVSMPDDPYWGLFGDYKAEIIKNTTVSEVIAKLKAYEDKHSDRIEVGDIVEVYGHLGVVTYMDELRACVMMVEDGSSGNWNLGELTKTGKHYDIQRILEAMRE